MTSDLWTNQSNEPFTCVTSHYTDSNMKLQKKILGFHKILHPYDGPSIHDYLTSVFKEYDIQSKKFSITYDNSSNNKNVINLFVRTIREGPRSEIFYVRYICHIINLIVLDGLKLISPSLKVIQSTIQFLDSSNKLQEFYTLCPSVGLKKRKSRHDIGHRWNSTYLMLKSCEGYHNILLNYVNTKTDEIIITSDD